VLKKPILQYYAFPLLWVGIAFLFTYVLSSVLLPLVTAFFLAYLIYPLIKRIQSWGAKESVAVGIAFFISITFLVSLFALLIPRLVSLATLIIKDFPILIKGLLIGLDFLFSQVGLEIHIPVDTLLYDFKEYIETISLSTLTSLSGVLQQTAFNLVSISVWILKLLVFPIFFFYALDKYSVIKAEFKSFVPTRYHHYLTEFSTIVGEVLSGYIRGQVVVCSILSVFFATSFWILEVPFGIVIGVLTGFSFLIPYVGFFVALLFGMIIALSNFAGVHHLLMLIAVYSFGQIIESYILTPKITGNRVGIDPFLTILVLIIGGNLLGFVGILIAIPVAAILKRYYNKLKIQYYKSDFFIKSNQ